jgi:hypothetical protein
MKHDTLECELLDRHHFKTQIEARMASSNSSKDGAAPVATIPPSAIYPLSTTRTSIVKTLGTAALHHPSK